MKRYIPTTSFSTYVGNVKASYQPNYVDRTSGLPGYSADDVPKQLRGSFREIDITETGADVVEQATAAPGEKRAAKPRTPKDGGATPAPVSVSAKTGTR